MSSRRREVEVFSLSFLDCICCGFGAIILMLVLTEIAQPLELEKSRKNLDGQVRDLEEQLHIIRGETDELNRELKGSTETLERERLKLARLSGDLTNIRGQYASSRQDASVTNIVEAELVSAYQSLSDEMQRLLKERARRPPTEAIAGILAESQWDVKGYTPKVEAALPPAYKLDS